jgi:PPOX class probable F420-dependent enzyme
VAKEQRRGRKIAMSPDELDAFLAEERTCRVATVRADGKPHVVPLWFAWDGRALWLNSIVKSQRWTDLTRDPSVSVVVDAGGPYGELRGVELAGSVDVVGSVPREPGPGDPALEVPERLFAEKYSGTSTYAPDGRHAWLRLVPDKIVSWDFRKLAALGS